MREKLVEHNFTVKWVPGKGPHIADALSCAPLFSPEETDNMHVKSVRVCMTQTPGMESELNSILDTIDSDYVKLWHDVMKGTELSLYAKQTNLVASQLSSDDELVYNNAKRIVLLTKAVKDILRLAHIPHA